MQIRHHLAVLVALGAAVGCVQGTVVQESPGALEAAPTWTTRADEADTVRLSGSLAPDGATQTIASVRLVNAEPGATYAWHVHYGTCEQDIGVVGESNAYPPLTIGSEGEGSARATLPFTTPTRRSGSFFVKVHDTGDMSAIVACERLVPRGVQASSFE